MLILASASPRREQLLRMVGLDFTCISPKIEEWVPDSVRPEDIPEYLAVKKAEAVLAQNPGNTVIGADTLVELDGQVMGKPGDERSAYYMLRTLSGKTHHVYTGVALKTDSELVSFTTVTKVEFYSLTDEEIWAYIHTGEPMDKAGGYAIQGKGALMVKRIQGDYYTVMGLPISEVVRHLRKIQESD